jgi:hypothetical protein
VLFLYLTKEVELGQDLFYKVIVNTKKWYRKQADLWAELGDEIPFG